MRRPAKSISTTVSLRISLPSTTGSPCPRAAATRVKSMMAAVMPASFRLPSSMSMSGARLASCVPPLPRAVIRPAPSSPSERAKVASSTVVSAPLSSRTMVSWPLTRAGITYTRVSSSVKPSAARVVLGTGFHGGCLKMLLANTTSKMGASECQKSWRPDGTGKGPAPMHPPAYNPPPRFRPEPP